MAIEVGESQITQKPLDGTVYFFSSRLKEGDVDILERESMRGICFFIRHYKCDDPESRNFLIAAVNITSFTKALPLSIRHHIGLTVMPIKHRNGFQN